MITTPDPAAQFITLSPCRRARPRAGPLALPALALASLLPAQATIVPVATNTMAALEAAVVTANSLAFQASPSRPVVIEFAANLTGQTIFLTRALPVLAVDYVTIRVA